MPNQLYVQALGNIVGDHSRSFSDLWKVANLRSDLQRQSDGVKWSAKPFQEGKAQTSRH